MCGRFSFLRENFWVRCRTSPGIGEEAGIFVSHGLRNVGDGQVSLFQQALGSFKALLQQQVFEVVAEQLFDLTAQAGFGHMNQHGKLQQAGGFVFPGDIVADGLAQDLRVGGRGIFGQSGHIFGERQEQGTGQGAGQFWVGGGSGGDVAVVQKGKRTKGQCFGQVKYRNILQIGEVQVVVPAHISAQHIEHKL